MENPSSEIQLREWFAVHAAECGFEIVASQAGFPDYILRGQGGRLYRVEAEIRSSNFVAHHHDPDGCDLVLCWIHDQALPLPVLELSSRTRYLANMEPPNPMPYLRNAKPRVASIPSELKARVTGEIADFIDASESELRIMSEYSRKLVEPRTRRLQATAILLRRLRELGLEIGDISPEDLLRLIA